VARRLVEQWASHRAQEAAWVQELANKRQSEEDERHARDSKVVCSVVDELFDMLQSRVEQGAWWERAKLHQRCRCWCLDVWHCLLLCWCRVW